MHLFVIAVVSASIPRSYSLVVRYKCRFVGLIALGLAEYHAKYEAVRFRPIDLLVSRLRAWAGALPRGVPVWHLLVTRYYHLGRILLN